MNRCVTVLSVCFVLFFAELASAANPPPAPTSLVVRADSTTQLTATWVSGNGSTTRFFYNIKKGTTAPTCWDASGGMAGVIGPLGPFTPSVPANITSRTMTNLEAGTTYTVSVCADDGTKNFSPQISVTQSTLGIVPLQPNFNALNWDGSNLTASWVGVGSPAGYLVAFNEGKAAPTCIKNASNTIDVGKVTSYSFPMLKMSTDYTVKVCSYNSQYQISSGSTRYVILPENIRAGRLEVETSGASLWDEFKSNIASPTYTFGENKMENLRPWIGTGANAPGFIAKQTLTMRSLIAGYPYALRLYPAYSSTSSVNWIAKVTAGSARIFNSDGSNNKTFAFPQGDAAVGNAWTLLFIANTSDVSIEVSGLASSGDNYLYIDAWDLIDFPRQVPANTFTFTSTSGPKLLGNEGGGTTRYSPKWRVRYNDKQFNVPFDTNMREYRLSTINKAIKYLYDTHIPEYNYDLFTTTAVQLVLAKDQLGKWIDESFDEIRGKWMACGGKYASYANSYVPSSANVTAMPASWYTTLGIRGFTSGQSQWPSRNIYSTVLSFSYLQSNPRNAMLYQTFRNIVAWEVGNQFGMGSRYFPGTTLASEIGSKSPCGR